MMQTRRDFLKLLGLGTAVGTAGLVLPRRAYSFLTNNPIAKPAAGEAVCLIPATPGKARVTVHGLDQYGKFVTEVVELGGETHAKFTHLIGVEQPGTEAAVVTVVGGENGEAIARAFSFKQPENPETALVWSDHLTNAEWGDGAELPLDPRAAGMLPPPLPLLGPDGRRRVYEYEGGQWLAR